MTSDVLVKVGLPSRSIWFRISFETYDVPLCSHVHVIFLLTLGDAHDRGSWLFTYNILFACLWNIYPVMRVRSLSFNATCWYISHDLPCARDSMLCLLIDVCLRCFHYFCHWFVLMSPTRLTYIDHLGFEPRHIPRPIRRCRSVGT